LTKSHKLVQLCILFFPEYHESTTIPFSGKPRETDYQWQMIPM